EQMQKAESGSPRNINSSVFVGIHKAICKPNCLMNHKKYDCQLAIALCFPHFYIALCYQEGVNQWLILS
ncbi:MAG: hypothetical protein OIF54_18120, partial [Cohaesibacter sp.]|nr:hypothetical protein [Cohaesibacter sp.]